MHTAVLSAIYHGMDHHRRANDGHVELREFFRARKGSLTVNSTNNTMPIKMF